MIVVPLPTLQTVEGPSPGGVQGVVQAVGGLGGALGLRGTGVRSCREVQTMTRDLPYL